MRKCNGFTLVEMLIVIAIIGIMSVTMVGSGLGIERYVYKGFTEEIAEMVQTAQQMATFRNESAILMLGTKNGQKTFELRRGKQNIEKQLMIPPKVSVQIQTTEKELQFEQDMSPTKGGTICIKHQGLKEEVHMTLLPATGKVTLYNDRKC